MPKAATLSSAVETATKCFATASVRDDSLPSIAPDFDRDAQSQSRGQPRVGQRLQRGERLRRDDEQRWLGSRSAVFAYMSVGSMFDTKPALQARLYVWLQRLVDHDGTEVGATDADVDDRRDLLAGDADPPAVRTLSAIRVHLVENLGNAHDHVGALDGRLSPRGRRRAVWSTEVLGHVDAVAADHRVAPRLEADLVGKVEQRLDNLQG